MKVSLVSPGSPITATSIAQATSHTAQITLPQGGGVISLPPNTLPTTAPGGGVPIVGIHHQLPQMASVITSSKVQAVVPPSLSNGHLTAPAPGVPHQASEVSSTGSGEKNGIDIKVEGKEYDVMGVLCPIHCLLQCIHYKDHWLINHCT